MALEDVGLSVQLTAELDRFQQNMRDAGRVVEATTGTMDKSTKRAADSFKRLEGALDPAAKALQRYERDVLKAVVAVDKKAVSDTRGANVIKLLSDQYERSIAKINASKTAMEGATVASNTFAQASTRGQNSARQMGVAIQQAGYQVGDFAVQVASGQSPLRAFIQQGTQFVSMFGPWGAAIGAAGAVLGAVATTFFDLGDNADEAGKKGTESLKDIEDQARRTKQELEGIASYYDRIALARARMDQVTAGSGVVAARARLDGLQPGQDPRAAQRALVEAQDAEQRAYMAERGILSKLADAKDNVIAKTEAEIKKTEELTRAMKVSRHEHDVTVETMKILADSGYTKTEKAARALAERVVTAREAYDAATKSTDKHSKATKKMADTYDKVVKKADQYFARLARENVELELKVNGQSDLIPLLKAENDLRDILGRELLPEEERRLKDILATRDKLNKKLAESEALTKASQEAAKEQERIWTHAAENIQDALADAIFSGKNLFQSLKDVALNVAKQIAAAMIFRPIIAPILGGVSGIGALGGVSGTGGAGGMMSLGSLSGIGNSLLGLLDGGLFSQSLYGAGSWFGTSAVGQALGLSTLTGGVRGAASMPTLTGLGTSFSSALGNLGYGAIGGLAANLFGLGNSNPWINMGASTAGSIGGSMLGGSITALGSLGGPLGAIAGGFLGSALGGLFGNNQPSDMFAQTGIDLKTGTLGNTITGRPDETSQQNMDASKALAQQFLTLQQQIIALTGGTGPEAAYAKVGSRDGIVVGVGSAGISVNNRQGSNSATFANSEEGAQKALDFMVQQLAKQITGNIDADIRKVLDKGGTSQEILDNLTMVKSILDATADTVDPLTAALKAVNDNFDDLDKKARDLGLSTSLLTKLETVRQKQLDEIVAGYSFTGYQNVSMALQGITGFLSSQALSDTSSLSPLAKQAAAAKQFNDLLTAVESGDLSQTGALTNAAQSYLGIARQNYGSTAGFSSVESYITQSLAALGQTLGSQESIGDQVTRAIQLSSQSNAEKLDEVKAEISKMVSKLSLYLSVSQVAA